VFSWLSMLAFRRFANVVKNRNANVPV